MPRPLIILHGYSDKPESAAKWRAILAAPERDYNVRDVHVGGYASLTNEVTIKDVAEAFDRALQGYPDLTNDEPFDAIVHSTGMLVIRAWLTSYGLNRKIGEKRRSRLKRLIGLAPATFGSPMAHKGRSWIGALVKGRKSPGPDFLEAGDQVLSALELGSKYTWDLAHRDLLENVYGPGESSPYAFVLIGTKPYADIRKVANEPGTDGTVRWAGCGFNVRKIVLDLATDPLIPVSPDSVRTQAIQWHNANVPLAFIDGHDHGSIFTDPTRTPESTLVDAVLEALQVDGPKSYDAWSARFAAWSDESLPPTAKPAYQQFVTRVIDEREDPVGDYFLELRGRRQGAIEPIEAFEEDVHSWREDESYRCFHVNLDALAGVADIELHLSARSGTRMVRYSGCQSPGLQRASDGDDKGIWDAQIPVPLELTSSDGRKVKLFYPFTTTLLEIRLNREPSFGKKGDVFWFEKAAVASPFAGV